MRKPKKSPPASIVWFEIPADKPERAREFYGKLFGWKINPCLLAHLKAPRLILHDTQVLNNDPHELKMQNILN